MERATNQLYKFLLRKRFLSIMSGLIACRTGTRKDFRELLIFFCFYVTLFGLGSPLKADLAISADVSLFVQSYNEEMRKIIITTCC